MIAFYIWFVYKAASGQSVRWLPGSRDSWWRVSAIALFAVMGYQLLFMHGMRFTAAGDASLIITMNPIFTVLLAAPILGQRITRKMIYGLLLSFIGVVVVTGWSPNTDIPLDERLKGDLMIMLAALCWATATNLTRIMLESEGEHGATSTEIVVWYSLVGTILLTPWWLLDVYHGGIQVPSNEDLLAILYLSILSTVPAYIWFVVGVERIGATSASSYVFLVPPSEFWVAGYSWVSAWGSPNHRFLLIVGGVRAVQKESSVVAGLADSPFRIKYERRVAADRGVVNGTETCKDVSSNQGSSLHPKTIHGRCAKQQDPSVPHGQQNRSRGQRV